MNEIKIIKLKANQKAPNFKGLNQNNELIELKNFIGKNLILFFYPKDNTPTCTMQNCNLRDNYVELLKNNFEIIGISNDNVRKHKNFEIKYNLPFNLIADINKEIVLKYGVYGNKKLFGREYLGIIRTTFIINKQGIIKYIINNPNSKNHSTEILNLWFNNENKTD